MELAAAGHKLSPVDFVGQAVDGVGAQESADAGHLELVPVKFPQRYVEAWAWLFAELIVSPADRHDALLAHDPSFKQAAKPEHRFLLRLRAGVGCLGPACVRNL